MNDVLSNPAVLALVIPLVLYAIARVARELNQHNLILYALSVPGDEDSVVYRLFLQNVEDVPLRLDWVRVSAEALSSGGSFQGPPDVYAGPHPFTSGITGLTGQAASDRGSRGRNREAWLEFHELPAHDTWVIEWQGNSLLRDVRMSIREVDGAGRRRSRQFPIVDPIELRVRSGDPPKIYGKSRTPSVGVGLWSIGAACVMFWAWRIAVGAAFGILASEPEPPLSSLLHGVLATGIVLVGGLLLLMACQRPSPIVIQGYLDRSRSVGEP